jgi:hypothetical protein
VFKDIDQTIKITLTQINLSIIVKFNLTQHTTDTLTTVRGTSYSAPPVRRNPHESLSDFTKFNSIAI